MIIFYNASSLFRDRFLFFLLLFSYCCIQVTCSKWEVYHLKMSGTQVEGVIESVEINENNSFRLRYSYKVDGEVYTGNKHYGSVSYRDEDVKQIREKMISKHSYPVYYDPKKPEKAVCFIADDQAEFPYMIWVVLLICWGIFVIRYRVMKN